jgi:hypothetical protein
MESFLEKKRLFRELEICRIHHGSLSLGSTPGLILSSHSQMVSVTIYVVTFSEKLTDSIGKIINFLQE